MIGAGKFAQKRGRILASGRNERVQRRALAHLAREAGAVPIHAGRRRVGYSLPDGSTICEKRRYKSEGAAVGELDGVQAFAHLNPNKTPVRAYECPHCKGWHVTSWAHC